MHVKCFAGHIVLGKFLKRFYLCIFLESGKGKEKEGEKHEYVRETSISCPLHGPNQDLAHNPGLCPDQELNWQTFSFGENTQPIELP